MITAAHVDEFREELLHLVKEGATDLTIDLAEVEMIDSRGLSVFVLCHRTLLKCKGQLTVVTHSDDLHKLFTLMRLDQHFTVKAA